ncbi:MAG: polyphosphate kinase 1 [Chitinophagaceae bacterium]|nr:polyphosphate kinase 1 [Chitinophagaceae bacterium]
MPDEKKSVFVNRDLTWLSFNYRVLMESADESVPLYNRIQFLSIFSSNLDEFFRVRMPSIFAFTQIHSRKTSLRDEYPEDLVKKVQETVVQHQEEFGRILRESVLPALRRHNILLYYEAPLPENYYAALREYFLANILSFLQPVFLSETHPGLVFLENNALYYIVALKKEKASGAMRYALLNIPSDALPRFVKFSDAEGKHHVIFLDDIIRQNLQEIFPGYEISGAYSVKLTRDAELNLEDEFSGDLAEKIEKHLERRDKGPATRLLFDEEMPAETRQFIKFYFSLRREEMIEGGRYHNLKDLSFLPLPDKDSLSYEPWPSQAHAGFDIRRSVFESMREKDLLLHLPYHSYNPILRFFNEAAMDPEVKEIYVTLYRVAANSLIGNALISAAKNGKKVTVFVELKARFDEANNLKWSKKMKAAGVKIINSIPRLKVHAKVALVRKQEGQSLKNYSLMATGNFNELTGRFYTDHVLFTTHQGIGEELEWLFAYLQSRQQPEEYGKIPFRHLLVSQFNMVKRFNKLIHREIENAKSGNEAAVIIKVNNLQEKGMIEKLYEAARAGVKVHLLVRSICVLAPGVPGQSENISVTRIVDRYLEHARIFIFHNNGKPEYYMGSADWMSRNLYSRIEVCFPVYDAGLYQQLQQIIRFQLNDNKKAVLLQADLSGKTVKNIRKLSLGEEPLKAQESTYRFVKSLSEK